MKKIFFSFIITFIILCSFLFPEEAVAASKQGITTWFEQILPALLPFTILSGILLRSKFMESFGASSNLLTIILTLVCGFIFGFPVGAKLASDFYSRSLLTKRQAIILCVTANNFSMMYVFGFVIPTLFPNKSVDNISYIILYLIPLLVSIFALLTWGRKNTEDTQKNTASRFQLDMQIVDAGIISGFESLIKICGYIVLFSLASRMLFLLWQNTSLPAILIVGNLEITNGITLLSQIAFSSEKIRYLLAIQFLSFGGISGLAQTASIMKLSGLPIKDYVIGKLLLTLLLLIACFNIYNG
ncbi:MAG: hypothetical protein E7283_01065 [Lachnospiraceae bacterium]|nr:hypothetical protein [Lachnospiraceae bacterium]